MQKIKEASGAAVHLIHQCVYNLRVWDGDGVKKRVKKPTGMMTDMPPLAWTLNETSSGKHAHTRFIGSTPGTGIPKTRMAQEYPRQLCQAIIDGIILQKQWDKTNNF